MPHLNGAGGRQSLHNKTTAALRARANDVNLAVIKTLEGHFLRNISARVRQANAGLPPLPASAAQQLQQRPGLSEDHNEHLKGAAQGAGCSALPDVMAAIKRAG